MGRIAHGTDVLNQDKKPYKLKVQEEGKSFISTYRIYAKGSMYGLCNASFCSFAIAGSKIVAGKNDRIMIRDGKFVR